MWLRVGLEEPVKKLSSVDDSAPICYKQSNTDMAEKGTFAIHVKSILARACKECSIRFSGNCFLTKGSLKRAVTDFLLILLLFSLAVARSYLSVLRLHRLFAGRGKEKKRKVYFLRKLRHLHVK